MAIKVYLVFAVLSVSISHTIAMSFVNNATVPSDILTNIFFDEVRNNPNLLNISVRSTGIYDSQKCILGLQEIVNRFPSFDVLPFVDAWGKIPSGLLMGHLQDLGNYEQCLKASTILSEATGLVNGQYCFAYVPLITDPVSDIPEFEVDTTFLDGHIRISIAICVPDTCEPNFIKEIFQNAVNNTYTLSGALSKIGVDRCQTAKKPDFAAINIFGIVVFSIFGALIVLSTTYDVYTDYVGKSAVPVLLAFSLLSNGRKLFTISHTKSANSIECLIGIRVLSMCWVLYCHTYSLSPMMPLINIMDMIEWFKAASTMHITMGSVSVDTFLFLSGLLVAWLGFRELDKGNGKLNITLMYFHRYIRLTPPVAAIMLFFVSIYDYVGIGPYSQIYQDFHNGCKTKWWSTLLYIQNYANPDNICVPQSWYLAVDTQLYVLSPLILIPLWKWGRKFVPVMCILSIISMTCVFITYYAEGYTQFMGVMEKDQLRLTYTPTHTRFSIWLIGIGLGYFMYKNQNKQMRPPKLAQFLAWIVCFATILAIIYGPYFSLKNDRIAPIYEAAIYECFKRVAWGVALSWIVFACHFGFGGRVNSFLSHPAWQPLGRLTFSLYLVHMIVQTINYGRTRTDVHFSDYTETLLFWSAFGISLMAAIVLTLTFEAPVLVIEKALLGAAKQKQTQKQHIDVNKNEYIIESFQKSA